MRDGERMRKRCAKGSREGVEAWGDGGMTEGGAEGGRGVYVLQHRDHLLSPNSPIYLFPGLKEKEIDLSASEHVEPLNSDQSPAETGFSQWTQARAGTRL